MVILTIYNTLNIDDLQINLFLEINENKYELKSMKININ